MTKLSKLEVFFMTKKDLWDRVVELTNGIENLEYCYKKSLETNEKLEKRVSELEELCKGLVNNYQEVTSNLNNIFGVEDIDPSKENQAKNERNSFAKAVAEVFDWSDVEE